MEESVDEFGVPLYLKGQRDPIAGGLSDFGDLDTSGLQKYLADREHSQVTNYLDQVKPGPQLTPEQAAQVGQAPAAPTWMDSYKSFQADHVRNFGVDMNRPWTADADAEKAKGVIDQRYVDNLNAYNQKYGKDEKPDRSVFGVDAQPNTYTPTDHSNDGALGGVAKSLGMTTNQLVGGVALAVGGWALASAMAPTAAAAASPAAATGATAGTAVSGTSSLAGVGGLSGVSGIEGLGTAAFTPGPGIIESALASPIAKPALNAGITLAKTGNVEKALTAGAGAYVGAEFVAPAVGGWAKEALGASKDVSSMIGNVGSTAIQGGDPIKALQSGAVGVAAGLITKTVPGFDSLGKEAQSAITSAVTAQISGKSPTDALIASARNIAINMATNRALPDDAGPGTRGFVNTVASTVLPQVGSKKRKR